MPYNQCKLFYVNIIQWKIRDDSDFSSSLSENQLGSSYEKNISYFRPQDWNMLQWPIFCKFPCDTIEKKKMFLLFFVHLVPKIFGKMVSLLQISPSIRLTYQFCWCELKRAVNSTHGSLVLSLFKVATAEPVRDAIVKLYYAELFFSYFGSVRKNTSASCSCELR